ncbi:PEP-CTERM sorting domain-containing protein [Rugamonas sp. FT82W]|uniref:PEP-CTERM sorting domain-containing protein n=1 Tax=Duganella vulcania TaxID=2692166 RepID=A0A845GB02_9BURK|nr:PEP-CTERM sorting domain-containing protein [Duganella vulcania]MYM90018.1 PEP-CTERM sorting domain-containing protein [Duganella vulcania]
MHLTLRQAVAAATSAACIALAGGAQAAADPLHNAVISASYNGDAAGMLGLDHGFNAEPGSNVSGLDPNNPGAEFLSADYLLAFDFAPDGSLTIYNNGPIDGGSHSARFDFGATLAASIAGFSVIDSGATSGTPVLTIIDSHTIAIDLAAVNWNGDFNPLRTAITLQAAPVPEPAAAWTLLAGLAGMGALVRRRKPQR